MSDSWFNEKIAPDGAAEDGCRPDEAQALNDYYNKETTPKEAAQAITRPMKNSKTLAPICTIPALIQLLEAIQQLPEPDLTGRLTESAPADGFLWRRLPGFGHMWADEHKPDDWRRTLAGSDPTKGAQLRAQHVRKAEIEAQLAVADVGDIPLDWGYDCIADALESYNTVLDFEIPAAAKWIAIAGKRLHAGAVGGKESWALERQRDCGKECKLMNLERWSFWEERLKELFQQSEATQDAANSAIHEMKALDS